MSNCSWIDHQTSELWGFEMCSQYSLVLRVASEKCISYFHGTTCNWCQRLWFGEKLRGAKIVDFLVYWVSSYGPLKLFLQLKMRTLTVHIPETSQWEYLPLYTRAFLYCKHLLAPISGCRLKVTFWHYLTGEIKIRNEILKSNKNIHKKEGGSYYVVSANKASSVTLL